MELTPEPRFRKTLRQVARYAGRRTGPPTAQLRHRLTNNANDYLSRDPCYFRTDSPLRFTLASLAGSRGKEKCSYGRVGVDGGAKQPTGCVSSRLGGVSTFFYKGK